MLPAPGSRLFDIVNCFSILRVRGSPAYAGMVPQASFEARHHIRLPRLRGDGPCKPSGVGYCRSAPPPTRGWSLKRRRPGFYTYGSPAYAGMVPNYVKIRELRSRLPRLRGDGPSQAPAYGGPAGAPPPTRGWSLAAFRHQSPCVGSPAYAGMVPDRNNRQCPRHRLPRLRGDGPYVGGTVIVSEMAPPPTRGWSPWIKFYPRDWRGSPAYAGMVPVVAKVHVKVVRLPRLRGDGPQNYATPGELRLAPPPTRGWSPPWLAW